MFKRWFLSVLYVQARRNRFFIRNVVDHVETEVKAPQPFTTERLLVGEFTSAEAQLKGGIDKVIDGRFRASPVIVIQPMEMIEGGLSQVEERIFRELAAGAGARKVIVWTGKTLTDEEVLAKANNIE